MYYLIFVKYVTISFYMALVIRLYFDIRSHLPYTIFYATDEFQENNNNTENLMIKSTDFKLSAIKMKTVWKAKCLKGFVLCICSLSDHL